MKPKYLIKDIYSIDDEFLKLNETKGIIFDIDNTLVGFTVAKPSDKVIEFIKELQNKGVSVAIASNNKAERVKLFCEDLDVDFVWRACKPLPFSLLKIAKKMKLKPKNIMLVGDQVFTDVWGANFIGMTSVMVDIIDTKECFTFKLKRTLEKPIINAKIREDKRKNGKVWTGR